MCWSSGCWLRRRRRAAAEPPPVEAAAGEVGDVGVVEAWWCSTVSLEADSCAAGCWALMAWEEADAGPAEYDAVPEGVE